MERMSGGCAKHPRPSIGRRLFTVAALLAALLSARGMWAQALPALAAGGCTSPANAIVAENCLPGTDPNIWDISGAGDSTIQGFATDISYNVGDTARFKINTTANAYTIDIYRMGYYGGMGARLITSILPSASLPQHQPTCLSDSTTGLVDCGNWAVSASWAIPSSAVSGIYFAKLTRTDTGGSSHIVFIVRNDSSHSDLLFQTSDTTWEAYNQYGQYTASLYTSTLPAGRAYKVSYNRPFDTRAHDPMSWVFNAEYPMVRWLESNGYDVSYFSGVDTDRRGQLIKNHKTFLSVGHDEYWSNGQRANVVAARDAGVNLAFFSGNEMFWKTRYENSIDGTSTSYRTLVCYKETHAGQPIDPQDPPTWTGTWRDARFSPPADGGRPENAVTGQIFMVNAPNSDSIVVPSMYASMRLWRNTAIASLAPGASYTFPAGVLGYEFDEDLDNGFRPTGSMQLSSTTLSKSTVVSDPYGESFGSATVTHHLTLYRAASGALVFGAGTVQWSWGLDSDHDLGGAAPDPNMQQATVNLLADMGAQPGTLQPGLVSATASTDTTPPTSTITSPASGSAVQANGTITISGTAQDTGGVVGVVEVSLDGGSTWHPATGRTTWTYAWSPQSLGTATIMSRAWDDSGNVQTTPSSVTVTVNGPTCPCSLWSNSTTPTTVAVQDANPYELGVKFRSMVAGYVTGVRFYKSSQNTGTHLGDLWDSNGNLLATATFTNESASGWQQVSFSSQIAISPNTTYVVSYHTNTGYYSADRSYFNNTYNSIPLSAPADTTVGGNGVYRPGGTGFPNSSFSATNYWVDVVFTTTYNPSTEPPYVTTSSPANGASGVATSSAITATFSKAMNSATITGSTFVVRDAANNLVNAAVSFNSTTNTATLTATGGLNTGTTYTATVKGGSGGVLDNSGNPIPADYVWTFTTTGAPQVLAVTPANGATGIASSPKVTASFSQTMNAGTITTSTFQLLDPSNNPVASTVTFNSAINTATLTPSSSLGLGVTYTAVVRGGSNGVHASSGSALASDYAWTFTVHTCPCTLWDTSVIPTTASTTDAGGFELGLKFRSDVSGYITGVRFYKGSLNTGNHLAHLWSSTGQMLAEALFSNETASGWQTVSFDRAVAITANTTYVVSYHTDVGHFAVDRPYFGSAYDNVPLHALADASSGGNGVYLAGASGFPTSAYNASNYWVDPIFVMTVPPDTTPPAVTSVTPAQGATGVSTGATLAAVFSEAIDTTTLTSSTFFLRDANNNLVTASVTYTTLSHTATLTPSVTLTMGATYTATLKGGTGGVKDLAGNAMVADYSWSFTIRTCPCTLWDVTATPTTPSVGDASAVELGVKFRSDTSGYITGVRFYKGGLNTGTHLGHLWDSAGHLLAAATFTNETASGWQTVSFDQAVAITANTTYVISYHTDTGYYSADRTYFTNGYDNAPLHALADAASGGNGVYLYGSSGFPTNSYSASNYWVDPIFAVALPSDTTPPSVTSTTPAQGATGISTTTKVTASFSKPLNASTVTASTFLLRDASNNLIATTIAYTDTLSLTGTTHVATLAPSASLIPGATYTATLKGGTGGVKDLAGNAMVADYSWSFTVRTCPCTLWSDSTTPTVASTSDAGAFELGVKFRSDVAGYVTGVRFYKGSLNTGTHTGHLWDSNGNLLATVTFTNETASGWQTATFSSPVAISANTIYVISYHTDSGHFAVDRPYFTNGYDNAPLHALADAASGGNGVYLAGASGFPTSTYNASNYWVDVVFTTQP